MAPADKIKHATARTRVLFVIAGLPAGGAERQLALLLRGLDRDSFEPGLLIFNLAEKIHYRDVLETPLWFRALGLSGANPLKLMWPMISGIQGTIRDFAPDVVYATLNVANHATRLSKLLFRWRAPVVTSVRVGYRDGYRWHEKLAERLLWRQSASVICNASATRDEIIADIGLDPDRVAVIPNGLDPVFFTAAPAGPPSWWPEGRVALTLGRFSDQKNHLALVEALSAIDRSSGLGEWTFVFAGEGMLERSVHAAIAAAGLDQRILIRPKVSDPRPLYHGAQLVILPSRFEGMPNVALEAQAAGCPVAITAAANRAGVVSGDDGFVLEGDLGQSLAEVLRRPAAHLNARGRAARERMLAEFSSDRMVQRTQHLLSRVAAGAADRRLPAAADTVSS